MVPGGSQPKIYQIHPLDFFPLGPLFQRYLTVKFRQTAPSSDYFRHLYLLYKMAPKEVNIFGTFALQTHGRPKIKAFQKTPSKFASKNLKNGQKEGVVFRNFYEKIVNLSI